MSAVSNVLLLPSRGADFDVERIRQDFPILSQTIHGKPLVYLDNAATTQKPRAVLDELRRFYTEDYSNIHRGVHLLSQRATQCYEEARVKAQHFINAADWREIVFVRGATEAINLVAQTYGRKNVAAGDEIVITALEHHSNLVPWQMLCEEKGASLRVAPINDQGELLLEDYAQLLNEKTRLVAVAHVSNALGTVLPLRQMIDLAHARGIPVLVDGAQAAPHITVDVQELDCDFYAFSGHKMYGPTGIGVLYGKRAFLDAMPPYQGGGSMISSVSFEKTTYAKPPARFEAGTPDIAGAVGLGAAMDYIGSVGLDNIAAHEADLLSYAAEVVSKIDRLRVVGTAANKASVLSFVLEGVHPHDIGTILDQEGVAVRAGHHCAQPVMKRLAVAATVRASFGLYNTRREVDALAGAIRKVFEVFG